MRDPLLLYACLYLLAINAATLIVFAIDKRRARRERWRTSERTLHVFELLGGWPAALAAVRLLRHKTRDRRYRLVQFAIVVLHVGVGVALALWELR